jgi:hypothetical protein
MKWNYFQLGFDHILDLQGYDHILFLVALCLPFLLKDWKKVVILATAFTIGHSITLACVSLEILKVSSSLVEFFIPVTIALTAMYDLIKKKNTIGLSYLVALLFGFIHGMGFSNFFKSSVLPGEEHLVIIQLLVFNLGIEVGQIIIVVITLIILALINLLTKDFKLFKKPAYQVILSVAIILWSLFMAYQRIP